MRFNKFSPFIFCAVLIFSLAPSAWANVLRNPGFEEALGESNWDVTNGASLDDVANIPGSYGDAAPFVVPTPVDTYVLRLETGEFTFQTVNGVNPGAFVVFRSFAISDVDDDAAGGRVCIEFKYYDISGASQLISQTCSGLINDATTGEDTEDIEANTFTAQGTAPQGTQFAVFVLKTDGNVAGGETVLFESTSAEINPAKLSVASSKPQAAPGEIVTIFSQFRNDFANDFNNVDLISTLPPGFNLIEESIKVDGHKASYREGSIIIPVGTVAAGATRNVAFQLGISSGVTVGKNYSISIRVTDGNNLSETASTRIQIVGDPLFDEGTIIGKVFNDLNENGTQDKGEKGVPGVRLATEEGIVIMTDEFGRYHIPAVRAGRHLVKIDGHSLPEGTKFVTEEAYLVKMTPGIMGKANFAVHIPEDAMAQEFGDELSVMVTQGLDMSHPVLEASVEPSVMKIGVGVLQSEAVFRFNTNYSDFAKQWYLEVRDEIGNEVWTGFGIGAPPREVTWSGQMENGLLIKEGIYSYQLKMEDDKGHQDWSPLYFFRVLPATASDTEKSREFEIPPIGDFNLFKDGKQSIPLVAKPTIRIQGKTKPDYKIFVNHYPVQVQESGQFQTEVYASPGEKDVHVTATSPEGESIKYEKKITVKDSAFFMAALTEGQGGLNFQDGNIESSGSERTMREGLYEDGRLSYYLKGKLKGKFLIKSHYDTEDKRTGLFTNLDPDDYYPIYGDASTRDYSAIDTESRFYVLVEMDRSFAKWGSFKTAFTDTELAAYNRTLSGLKVHHETVSTTPYGDPKRGFTLFSAKSEHLADHNEFVSTGGSLYYLRHRLTVEGSEKVRVEVRDKVQDMAVLSTDLVEGQDYEIDYSEGRILLNRPLISYTGTDLNSSIDIMNGDNVYLVVDYEYDPGAESFDPTNRGLRGYTHMGDHVRIGGTAVEEKRDGKDYDLRSVDARLKFGRNTKVTAEYAESHLQQTETALSYNGGMDFLNRGLIHGTNTRPRENAYLVKAESKPVKNTELSGYVQTVEPGFSSTNSTTQEGYKKYGTSTKYKFTDNLYSRYRFDHSEVVDQLRPLNENGLTASFLNQLTHSFQTVYDNDQWLAEAEYQRQETELPNSDDDLAASIISEAPFDNALSGKLGYRINEKLLPYVKMQTTIHDKPNHQAGGGFRYKLKNGVYAYLEQLFGTIGDATQFGFERYDANGVRSYSNIKMWDLGPDVRSLSTTLGNSFSLTEKSRMFTERQYSEYLGRESAADILGNEIRINDHWSFEGKFERRHLDSSRFRRITALSQSGLARNTTFHTLSGGVSYKDKKVKARVFLEGRRDQGTPQFWQTVARSFLEYQMTDSLGWRSKLDWGKSHFRNPADTPADFMEFNTGFAYRPVDHDRFNMLARYSYLRNIANDVQFQYGLLGAETDETAHIWVTDFAYDISKHFTFVEKLAYKTAVYDTSVTDQTIVNSFLWANRINFHVTKKWDLALEYRTLWQMDALRTLRQGALVEVDREFYDYVRLGVGYNFTDFSDDLRHSDNYDSHGPFVRLTGKF